MSELPTHQLTNFNGRFPDVVNASPWTTLVQPFSKRRVHDWLYEGYEEPVGPHVRPTHTASWWKVMCLKFLAFGEGDTAPVTREVLRKHEPDPLQRPRVHVG